jgi:hypothetical protein
MILLIIIFMIHGIMGSFMLLGEGNSAGKILAWQNNYIRTAE